MTGIYIIKNTINGKRYVGQSINIHERWNQHRCNPQPKMRADVEKYGWDAFKFDVLEECPREILTERENYYIKLLKPEYNAKFRGYKRLPSTCKKISVALMGHTFTDDARIRMSKKRLGVKGKSPECIEKLRQKSLGNKSKSKPVLCVEKGIVYPSAKAAGEALGIDPSGISANLRGIRLQAGGFTWRYPGEDPTVGSTKRNIAIICIETGETFPSIEAAARHFNINSSTLADILYGESISSLPYHWKLVNEERERNTIRDESSRKNYAPIPVICIETGETYSSIRQAAKALGISNSSISSFLNGRVTHAEGFHFKYADGRPIKNLDSLNKHKTSSKPIRCLETEEVFESIAQAARSLGLTSDKICGQLHGRKEHVQNLHFEYTTPHEKRPKIEPNEIYQKRNKPEHKFSRRPIICIETDETFDSISEAAIKMGLNSAHLGEVVRGKRRSIGGFHFKDISENKM